MQACLSEDRNKNPVGGEAKDPRDRKGTDGYVGLLGRSHQERPEAKDTLTMISHGVEISIAEVERTRKMKEIGGFFSSCFLFFLYHIFGVKVQEITWSGSYGENKTQNPKRTNKRNIRNNTLELGSVPVPGPHMGAKLKQVH